MKCRIFACCLLLGASMSLMADNYVIINQVMYDSPFNEVVTNPPYSNGEFIELYNGGDFSASLNGWYITGESPTEQFYFPNISIPAKGYLAVAFRHQNSPSFSLDSLFTLPINNPHFQLIYQSSVILANHGETITLYEPNGNIADQIVYDGTSHKTKPDRLSAENADTARDRECLSLHRTWVEFDENGLVVLGTSQWKTDYVSFVSTKLADPNFYEHYLTGGHPLPSGANYILSVSPLNPTTRVSVSGMGISVSNGVRTRTQIQYYDGLGRPDELIDFENTPTRKDLVHVTHYNGLHRATQHWLPVYAETNGQYMDVATVQSQVQSLFSDSRPYVETLYENSSLERIVGHKRAGATWANNPSSVDYTVNDTPDDHVRIYTVTNDGKLKTTGEEYFILMLYKTVVADEDGKSVVTFTDKLGRKIMEERDGNKTYYVYDDLGRLRFVLPHISTSLLSNGEYALTNSVLKAAAYCYDYDERGNMTYKRLPGCEPQYMVYDMLGQLVLKQDGNQRTKNKWTLCAYDSIGRNLYTAEIVVPYSHAMLKSMLADRWCVEHYGSNQSNAIPGTGYASALFALNNLHPLTLNYYDNYDYLSRLSTPVRKALRFKQDAGYGLQHDDATGRLTGTRVYNLSEDGYTATAYYYDMDGRVVQSRSTRNAGGYTATSNEYMFDGTIAQQLITQGTDSDCVREHYRYTYDHAGRTRQVYYQLNDETEIIMSDYSYDNLGHLAQNLLHNHQDTITYSFDMRDMLTESRNKHFSEKLYYADSLPLTAVACYNGNIAAARVAQTDTSFVFAYTYDALNRLTESVQLINGQNRPSEWFSYDARGNILRLQRYTGSRLLDDLRFVYQQDGNKVTFIRDNGSDIDTYGVIEYLDHNIIEPDMLYDDNGNMIYDADRGISAIRYNALNLPDTIQFANGNQLVNLYDAVGRKYKSVVYTAPSTTITTQFEIMPYTLETDTVDIVVTEYEGNIENRYSQTDTIRRIFNNTGYYTNQAYYHYIKDHLGNICAVMNSTADTLVQSTIYYPSGVPMAQNLGPNVPLSLYDILGVQYTENFGRDEQPYLYNSKEFVETHGLNEYDSYARRYYPAICRTTTMDPLAESYYHISPYAWCGNNPINRFDPDGRKWKTKRDIQIAKRLAKRANSKAIKKHSRLNKLEERRFNCSSEKELARIDKEMADVKIQIQRLENLERNITQLTETDKNTYTFNTVNGKIATLERADDGTIIINNYGDEGNRAHEVTHAVQYENGKLIYVGNNTFFTPTVDGGFLELEVEAYQTEYSISGVVPQSKSGDVESVTDIDTEWVSGVYTVDDKGNEIFPYKGYGTSSIINPMQGVFPWKPCPQILGL